MISRFILSFAMLALAGHILWPTALAAQTAGGVTVDDLRRIVAEQQKQLAAQQRMLQQLQARIDALAATTQRTGPPTATGNVATGAGQTPAETADGPPTVTSGEENVSLTISGQVNRAVLYANDGSNSEVFHVDNDNSSTRLRLVGKAKLTDDLSLGAQIEAEIESNSSTAVSQVADGGLGSVGFTDRKLEVYGDSVRFGRLWLGQGSTASDGVAEIDLSETTVMNYSSISGIAGGMLFVNDATGAFGPSVGSVFTNLDGLGRDDRIRYDTPRHFGLQASASHVSGGAWDASANYAAQIRGHAVAAAIGYADPSGLSSTVDDRLSGSASILLENGLNVTVAAGRDWLKPPMRSAPIFYYAKLGYIAEVFDIGDTAISVDFARSKHVAANGDEATSYGAFAVQNLEDYGTQFYLGARNHALDRPGADFDNIFAVMGGARVKF